jgi:hypothetical protein
MRISTLLIMLVIAGNLTRTCSVSHVYFKTYMLQLGFVFGKATNEINSENKLNVTFDPIVIDFKNTFKLIVVAVNNDETVKKKQR